MNFIIDTQSFIWASSEVKKLSKKVRTILLRDDYTVFLSLASVWEISIKYSLNKLELPTSPQAFVLEFLKDSGIQMLEIKFEHVIATSGLPFHHRDPFDRLIIAQAYREHFSVITSDDHFKKYEIETVW